jgi:hypothetical protein
MIKTGWVMEWENEVRYRAPMRAHMSTMGKAMIPLAEAMKRMQISFAQATKGLRTLAQLMDNK